jgi:predicted AAA+ superfamily ATPase
MLDGDWSSDVCSSDLAGRTAQEVNLSSLGGDCGVTHNTARSWLSILETSYIVHRLPAWHATVRKQVVKSPKLHFFDSGLLCFLLGIREPGQLALHPLRGAVFESWVFSEIYKNHVHRGVQPSLFHYREARGLEIDLVIAQGNRLDAVEIKSAATVAPNFFKNLERFKEYLESSSLTVENHLIYGGDNGMNRNQARVLSWKDIRDMSP